MQLNELKMEAARYNIQAAHELFQLEKKHKAERKEREERVAEAIIKYYNAMTDSVRTQKQ